MNEIGSSKEGVFRWREFMSLFLKFGIIAFLFCFLGLSGSLLGNQDDLGLLDELIAMTQNNLEAQQQLHKLMESYQKTREAFVADSSSQKLAQMLVKEATQILQTIEKTHLSHLFSSDLMTEVRFFSKVGDQAKNHG